MSKLPDRVITQAFQLSNARGAELLLRLGDFDVWHGDLAEMRRDEPRTSSASDVSGSQETEDASVFIDTLLLARAIERLQPMCRAALSAVYAHNASDASLAAELETPEESARGMVSACEKRLMEIYDSIVRSADTESVLPSWVSEREQVASGGTRRR